MFVRGERSAAAVAGRNESRVPERRGRLMTWTKPEFEIVDLCLEVTTYVYRR